MQAPQALVERRQWVLWRAEGEKGTKVPYQIGGQRKASSTDPRTWAPYHDVLRELERHPERYSGAGYVFSGDDGLTGVDLDDCRDPETGAIAPWARAILDSLNTYSEVSPSGTGVKAWAIGTLPDAVKTAQVEVYPRSRYFAVTGQRLDEYPGEPQPAQEALDALAEHYGRKDTSPAYATLPPSADSHNERWARRVLGSAVAKTIAAVDGEKHNELLGAARLAAGAMPYISEAEIEETLFQAIRLRAADPRGAMKTIRDGIKMGVLKPLDPPTAPTTAPLKVKDNRPWCPECAVEVRRSQYPYPGTDEPGWYCPECKGAMKWPASAFTPGVTKSTPTPRSTEYVVNPWSDIVPASQLRTKQFARLVWTVDDLLPEGCCLLAGRPKSKKSWLALQVAVAVATNGKVLGHYDVTPGRVLYLDLESNQRRMQSRLRSMIHTDEWPDRLEITTNWPRGQEGLELLARWLDEHRDARLVVIDILARIRPPKDPKGDPYEQDYGFLQQINALAESHNVTIIVIHHTRKARAEHVFDEISGTNGLMGAVATAWMLTVNPDEPGEQMLALQGRDVMVDDPLAVKWDSYLCAHLFVATGPEASSTTERRAILKLMAYEQDYPIKELAAGVRKDVKAVDNLLRRLIDDGLVTRTGRGRYARIPQHEAKPQKPVESVGFVVNVGSVANVESYTANFPHDDQERGKGVEKVSGIGTPETENSTFSTGISYSTDGVLMTDGSEQWRVWNDATGEIVATFTTEADALADATRRLKEALHAPLTE
jgi:hypothetical protein